MRHRTAWLVMDGVAMTNDRPILLPTPAGSLDSLGRLLGRIAETLAKDGRKAGVVLVDDTAVRRLHLNEPTHPHGLISAESCGWKYTTATNGLWRTFFDGERPEIHVGLVEELDRLDDQEWPFKAQFWDETISALGAWEELSGHVWSQLPAVMGVELIRRTMGSWRIPGVKGNQRYVERDEHTPQSAQVMPYTTRMWFQKSDHKYQHFYDRRRSGLAAATVAKCAAGALEPGYRKYDGKRAGWWQITVPAWNHKNLPHPCGYHEPGKLRWVTSGTMDLLRELEEQGLIAFPEVHDSWTGIARTPLAPSARLLEHVYQEAARTEHCEILRSAVGCCYKAGHGMLAAEGSSFNRYDWFASTQDVQRCNSFRKALHIGQTEKRWPVAFDGDGFWYGSDTADPVKAAPRALSFEDKLGGYAVKETECWA